MKKLFLFLLPLLAAAWLPSLGGCGKCKGIEGKVLEFGTDKPIPNATVVLSDCEGEILGNFNCTEVARTTTKTDGSFGFNQDAFAVAASAADYWDTGDDFALVTNECPEPVLHLYPFAWVEVTVKNESGTYRFTHGNNIDLHISKGETFLFTELVRGNSDYKFVFDIETSANDTTQTTDSELSKIKVLDETGSQVLTSLQNSWSPWFKVFFPGHKTTHITITY